MSTSRSLRLTHRHLPGATVIVVEGEIDAGNCARLGAYVREARRSPGEHLVFDLAGMRFMDSSGMRVLLMCRNEGGNGTVHLAAARPVVARLLEVTGLDTVLTLHDTVAGAVRSAEAAAGDPA